jgi:hypothetical protein
MIYAERLVRQFCKLSKLDVTPYCLTDRPEQLADFITPITPKERVSGWWNKVLLFDPELPTGWNLYLDIDIVILENFDQEILDAISSNRQIACVSDPIEWMGSKFNSSLMVFKTGVLSAIYEEFMKTHQSLANREGGDQVWMGPKFENIRYLDETYPNMKQNFKFQFTNASAKEAIIGFEVTKKDVWYVSPKRDKPPVWICKKFSDSFMVPAQPPKGLKMIDFSGLPKPHQLGMVPYINKNWHLV